MFLDKELHGALKSPPVGDEELFGELRAELASFTTLRWITPEYLWLLNPKNRGAWEIKFRRIEPQIRVFGHFAGKDVFLALSYNYRSDLGDIDNQNWTFEIRKIEHRWKDLFFGRYHAKKTSDPHELFTGAIDAKYFYD